MFALEIIVNDSLLQISRLAVMVIIAFRDDTAAKSNACALDFGEPKKNKHDQIIQFAEIFVQMSCRSFQAYRYTSPRLQLFHKAHYIVNL